VKQSNRKIFLISRLAGALVFSALLVFIFQNCTRGFQAKALPSIDGLAPGSDGSTALPSDGAPTDNAGGGVLPHPGAPLNEPGMVSGRSASLLPSAPTATQKFSVVDATKSFATDRKGDPRKYCPFAAGMIPPSVYNGKPVVRICPVDDMRPGCTSSSLADTSSKVADGTRIEIVGGAYKDCALITASNIEIVGVCGRPRLQDTLCNDPTRAGTHGVITIRPTAVGTIIENLEISDPIESAEQKNRGIAFGGTGLIVRYAYIHDIGNAITDMNHEGTGTVLIEHVRIENAGLTNDWFINNAVAMSGYVNNFYFSNNIIVGSKAETIPLSLNTANSNVSCSVIAGLNVPHYTPIVSPFGTPIKIENSIVQRSKLSVAKLEGRFDTKAMIYFGTSPQIEARFQQKTSNMEIKDSIFIDDLGGTLLEYFEMDPYTLPLTYTNNALIGIVTTSTPLATTVPANYNFASGKRYANRAEAGVEAETTKFPLPPGCPDFEVHP
jgi:hypothetical protein